MEGGQEEEEEEQITMRGKHNTHNINKVLIMRMIKAIIIRNNNNKHDISTDNNKNIKKNTQ